MSRQKRHRLLYFVGQLGSGGYERQLYYLLRGIDRERYRPAVVVWNFAETDPGVAAIGSLGVPLLCLPPGASAMTKLLTLRRLVSDLRPEVVHSYGFYTNFAAHWCTRGTASVGVGSLRSDFKLDKRAAGLWRGLLCARWPRFQISNNLTGAGAARDARGPFKPARIALVRNALDLDGLSPSPLPANGRTLVLGVGSLLPVKRWDRLIDAAAELKRRGLRFNVKIAGDGPLREELGRRIAELRLAEEVELLGHVEDVGALLARSALLAHTSDAEGCPNSVMEAMACGRAVVGTDAGDVPLLVEDGRTGYVVSRRDDRALTLRLANLIADRSACARMGELARAKAEREFGLSRLASETFDAYRQAGWRDA